MEQHKQHQDNWHSQTTDAVLKRFDSTKSGLSDKDGYADPIISVNSSIA